MGWTRFDVGGRVTALQGPVGAGATPDGAALLVALDDAPSATAYDDRLTVGRVGVLGVSGADGPYLSGRGDDGAVHFWHVKGDLDPGDPGAVTDVPFDTTDVMWAAPALGSGAAAALTARIDADGGWRLRAHLGLGGAGVGPRGRELRLGGPPDSVLSYAVHGGDHLLVAGLVGDSPEPRHAAWAIDVSSAWSARTADWRRVALAPTPSAISSVAVLAGRTWLAGRCDDRPVLHQVSDLDFRGPLRTTPMIVPDTRLDLEAPGRPVVLVENAREGLPVLVTSSVDGNRLWWRASGAWRSSEAPAGRLQAASLSAGRINVLVDGCLWTIPDPTGG